ncbi:MAG: hypothetical protein NT002_02865 [candidate division Zixibacteria bacterium]|nr:hypothetical protein [candidate division Zixibacteria bacterium]
MIDCYIHDNGGDAFYIDLASFPDISFSGAMNSYLFSNHGNGIKVTGGGLNTDAIWRDMGPCYWLADLDLTVGSDVTLTLDPGVIVKLSNNRNIIVNGTLHAVGTSDSVIYFTSYLDDQVRQDTEGASSTNGAVHDWQSLKFTASSVNDSLVNCVIKYGGGYYSSGWRVAPTIDIAGCSPPRANTRCRMLMRL